MLKMIKQFLSKKLIALLETSNGEEKKDEQKVESNNGDEYSGLSKFLGFLFSKKMIPHISTVILILIIFKLEALAKFIDSLIPLLDKLYELASETYDFLVKVFTFFGITTPNSVLLFLMLFTSFIIIFNLVEKHYSAIIKFMKKIAKWFKK